MPLRMKNRLIGFWRQGGRTFLIAVVALFAFRSAVADWNDVPTGSMKPTILEGDRIFVNKLAYDLKVPFTSWRLLEWGNPKRGEVVVLFSPKDGTRLVKRVVGLPGDRIELRDNRLVVNEQVLSYETVQPADFEVLAEGVKPSQKVFEEHLGASTHPVMVSPGQYCPIRSFQAVVVPQDRYMVMGDNRDNSADSRIFGFVPRGSIVGRSSRVVLSFNPGHYYLPRWGRFFQALP
jgi:signal peptidase I